MLQNVFPSVIASIMAACAFVGMRKIVDGSIYSQMLMLFVCALTYIVVLSFFPKERKVIVKYLINRK